MRGMIIMTCMESTRETLKKLRLKYQDLLKADKIGMQVAVRGEMCWGKIRYTTAMVHHAKWKQEYTKKDGDYEI